MAAEPQNAEKGLTSSAQFEIIDTYKEYNTPLIDKIGLIRVGGRVSESEVKYDKQHPFFLPHGHWCCKLIVEHVHKYGLSPLPPRKPDVVIE